jgi:hypothetical protein
MVKVAAPCLSLGASGSIAGALVFSTWKGRPYVRELVKPSNPKSGGQVGVRAMFKFLAQIWDGLTSGNKATWEDRADDSVISPFNAFVGYNQGRWRNFKGPSKEDPAAEVSTPALAPTTTPTGGVRQIELSIADGVTPPDWGYLIYRSDSTGFTPAFSNCIASIPWLVAGTTVYIDTPLAPGTYYYRIGGFMADGVKGALEAEVSGTAT